MDFCGILHLRSLGKLHFAGFNYFKMVAKIIAYAHYSGNKNEFPLCTF